jgi:methyl-accepting chemotaxis protein
MFFSSKKESAQQPERTAAFDKTDIQALEAYLKKLSGGDFSAPEPRVRSTELQGVARELTNFVQAQQRRYIDLLMEINDSVTDESKSSGVLNNIATEYEHIMQTVNELMRVVDGMAEAINGLAGSASETSRQTDVGRDAMSHTSSSVQSVAAETGHAQQSLQGMNQSVEQLHASTASIDNLVAVVNGIAEQTNLLALNASIEAARAGEHGRGFSVVAEEVRKLAEQSKQSVGEISEQLSRIRTGAEGIAQEFTQMDRSFQSNVTAVGEAQTHTSRLVDVFDGIGKAISDLAPMAEEQSASFEEMNATLRNAMENVHKLNTYTKECNKDIYEVLRRCNAMRMKAGSLNLPFSEKDVISLAKTDHLIWKTRIEQMLWGNIELKAADVADSSLCRLGKWYHATGQAKYGSLPEFSKLGQAHDRFHKICAEAIDAYHSQKTAKVREYLLEIGALSDEVIGALDSLMARV